MKTTTKQPETRALVAAVFCYDDTSGKNRWRQYEVLTASKTVSVDCEPAIVGGWIFAKITSKATSENWDDMSVERIVAWRTHNSPTARLLDAKETSEVLAVLARKGVGF